VHCIVTKFRVCPVKFFVSYSDFDYFFCIFVSLFGQIHQLTDLVMVISYPASLKSIIVLSKTLRHIMIKDLKKKGERKERSYKESRKKEWKLSIKCNKQRGRENLYSIRPGQEF